MNSTVGNATDAVSVNATEPPSLLWSLPRLFSSLSKAAEEQARHTHDQESYATIASFNYFISPYAGACMLMAIILNRTVVFASSRRQSTLVSRSPKIILRIASLYWIISTFWDVLLQFAYIYPSLELLMTAYMPKERQPLEFLLWEVFVTLCISQFLETFVSITSAQEASNDSGLTLFEHSLAFQECQFMDQPSPQLLFICSYSLAAQFTTHIVGLFNWKKYQLIPSTILGITFLSFYAYSAFTDALVYFPFIVVVSLIPQVLVLSIISICLIIYGMAVIVTRDTANLTYTPMIHHLRDSLNLQWHDDFNSLLMRFGFIMFNAMENEEYVNEMTELTYSKGTYQDNGHLISGYFNKLDNNPEMSQVTKKDGSQTGISPNWSFLRNVLNIFKLCQAIFKFFIRLRKGKPTPSGTQIKRYKSTVNDGHYSSLLNDDISLIDSDSEDYNPDSDSDVEALEYDSEVDDEQPDNEYISTLAKARASSTTPNLITNLPTRSTPPLNTRVPKPCALDELFTPNDIISLITPPTHDDASLLTSMRTHLTKDKRITRSQYCAMNEDDLLHEVITSRRPHEEHLDDDDLNCVVCQTERRCIVLWPCKCFALCEGCRLSLGVRGFGICVCCRSKVEGYSKVFMP